MASFTSGQVVGVSSFQTGQLFKSFWLAVKFKQRNGDEFELKYKTSKVGATEDAIKWLNYAERKDKTSDEIMTLMRTREKVAISEVCAVLARRGLPATEAEARRMLENAITSKKVDGVIEGSQFVSRSALQREHVSYQIVSNFDFNSSGAISFKCRGCGKSLPMDKKRESGKCEYCGSPYALPKKLLDMV
jgi:hypothetical protein